MGSIYTSRLQGPQFEPKLRLFACSLSVCTGFSGFLSIPHEYVNVWVDCRLTGSVPGIDTGSTVTLR